MSTKISLLSPIVIDSKFSALDLLTLLLKNRGVAEVDQSIFLKPPIPKINLNFSPALDLIDSATKSNKNILIYGDYDVDGITATAILYQAINSKYPHVTPFIPNRQLDGYGVKAESFFRFQKEKGTTFDLLITVDNGIVAHAELQKIKAAQDIKILVTDHHFPDGVPHSADVLLHSTEVSGAALAYFLAREISPSADMGLAALGTVADCLPLTGLNRSLVVHGLKELRLNPSPGIKKLIQIAAIKPDSLSAYDLGFALGPRINAVGRLSDPTDALRLLCATGPIGASKYAQSLDSFNQDRQSLQKDALDSADKNIDFSHKIIVISGDYNPGIIGLIAGRLTEKYYLPSVVIAVNGDLAKGSCRSIPELNIIDALREHSKLFIDLGGHPLAAGFSLKSENVSKLKSALEQSVFRKLASLVLEPSLVVDAQMQLSAVNLKNITAVEKLSPFGIGNSEPLFLFKDLKITSKKIIGSTGDHLKLKLNDTNVDALAFKKGHLFDSLKIGDSVTIVAKIDSNTWNGTTTPQLIIKEILIP